MSEAEVPRFQETAERVARHLYDTYALTAPRFGERRAKWDDLDQQQQALMIETLRILLASGTILPGPKLHSAGTAQADPQGYVGRPPENDSQPVG